MSLTLTISIINYGTAQMTIAAAHSALEAIGNRPGRIVIVDNASRDGSAEEIERWIEQQGTTRVTLVRSPTNSGFSGGHNLGIATAPCADFYLVLNSDALLRPDFFDCLLPETDHHPKVGLFAPRLEFEDGTPQVSCFRFASPASELIRGAETGPVSRLLHRHVTALATDPDPDQIEWASFACILLRADMVRQVGPMDEGYFLYFEDAEYALRAGRAGWGIRYVSQARAVHFRGGSGPVKQMQAARNRLPAYFWRSRTRFLRQAHGWSGPLRGNLSWCLGRAIAWSRLLTGRARPKAHQCEWRDIWVGFATPLRPDKAPAE